MKNILFVCTGNICRSPTAEYVFKHLVQEKLGKKAASLCIESRGTSSFHEGETADARAVATAQRHGVDMTEHIVHGITCQDLLDFDVIYCMDFEHLQQVRAMAGQMPKDVAHQIMPKIRLFLRDCAPKLGLANVPDPYYDDNERFEYVYSLIQQGCRGLISKI